MIRPLGIDLLYNIKFVSKLLNTDHLDYICVTLEKIKR